MDGLVCGWVNRRMDEWVGGWEDGWVDGSMHGWVDGWVDEWMGGDGWIYGWIGWGMGGWMCEWRDRWTDGWMHDNERSLGINYRKNETFMCRLLWIWWSHLQELTPNPSHLRKVYAIGYCPLPFQTLTLCIVKFVHSRVHRKQGQACFHIVNCSSLRRKTNIMRVQKCASNPAEGTLKYWQRGRHYRHSGSHLSALWCLVPGLWITSALDKTGLSFCPTNNNASFPERLCAVRWMVTSDGNAGSCTEQFAATFNPDSNYCD
jgi:hypothetical protein